MTLTHNRADWIAVDWGTSRLRAWAMTADGEILASASSAKGMGSLAPYQFEAALLEEIGDWLALDRSTPVIACGMVGARQGWIEAHYETAPCAPAGPLVSPAVNDPRISVHICPGVKQHGPADVMRGEETQVAGLLAANPGFEGVICLPGTHSKWVRVQAGQVAEFQTFMTGELYALLSGQSVLRHSVANDGWDGSAFAAAVETALEAPASISARLFSLRAESLLADLSPQVASTRLSGYLIGLELAAARGYWSGQAVAIIGASQLGQHYAEALRTLGVQSYIHNSDAMTLKGLTAAYHQLIGA